MKFIKNFFSVCKLKYRLWNVNFQNAIKCLLNSRDVKEELKRNLLLIILLVIFNVTGIYMAHYFKAQIILRDDNGSLKWLLSRKVFMSNKQYAIIRNNTETQRINSSEFTDNNKEDIAAPLSSTIEKVEYKRDSITISWNKVEDLGSDNNYRIYLLDRKGRKLTESNIISQHYISGVDHYIVTIGDSKEETSENTLTIDKNKLTGTKSSLSVQPVDKKGNVGAKNDTGIYLLNYPVDYLLKEGGLDLSSPDTEQDYTYKIIYNNEELDLLEGNLFPSIFKDSEKPNSPNPTVLISNESATVKWDKAEDIGSKYVFYAKGYGGKYNNVIYSKDIETTITSGIKGYLYQINSSSDYQVTLNDTFTEDISIKNIKSDNTCYLHVATIDKNDNISDTKTVTIKIPKAIPTVHSTTLQGSSSGGSLISTILFKANEQVTDSQYNIEKSMMSKLPTNVLNLLKKLNIKIYVTNENLSKKYAEQYGRSTSSSVMGYFDVWSNTMYISTKYPGDAILHEIGHVVDECSIYNKTSHSSEFTSIFNAEKDILITNSRYLKSTVDEYYAESFALYFTKSNMRNIAPRTYEFMAAVISGT